MSAAEREVVVVGAGLAGLLCAEQLQIAGADVEVLEAAQEVGGRVRTDVVDGFRLDRGFQVLNPAYPAVRRHIDTQALSLNPFYAGVMVAGPEGNVALGDPRREPRSVFADLSSPYAAPREILAASRWSAPALGLVNRLLRQPDTTVAESLDAAGVTGRLRHEVIDPFLAGVLLDHTGSSSALFAKLLVRAFLFGTPSLPAQGMGALPAQLAGRLRRGVTLGSQVESLTRRGPGWTVSASDGERHARAVVVATDPATAASLTPVAGPAMKGCATWWFSVPATLQPSRALMVDGIPGRGPLVNTALMSAVAPSYAPIGAHLVQATAVLTPGSDTPGENDVRAHLAQLWRTSVKDWEVVSMHEVRQALPAQPPPLQARQGVDLGQGLFVCGDHRDTASIQGALVSGRRTARAVCGVLGRQLDEVSRYR